MFGIRNVTVVGLRKAGRGVGADTGEGGVGVGAGG